MDESFAMTVRTRTAAIKAFPGLTVLLAIKRQPKLCLKEQDELGSSTEEIALITPFLVYDGGVHL